MVDFKKSFDLSYIFVKKYKSISIPFFLSIFSFYLFFISGIFLTGLDIPLLEIYELKVEYNNYVEDQIMDGNLFVEDFKSYFKKNFNWRVYNYVLTIKNAVFMIFLFFSWIFISSYFRAYGFFHIAKKLNSSTDVSKNLGLMSSYLSFIGVNMIFCLAILFYTALFLALMYLLFYFSISFISIWALISVFLLIFILVLIFLYYLILLSLKFFFGGIIVFYENKNILNSINQSFEVSKGKMKKLFMIALMIYGITAFANSFAGQPIYKIVIEFLFLGGVINSIILFILFILFIVAFAFLGYFLSVFRFIVYSYFKDDEGKDYEDMLIMK